MALAEAWYKALNPQVYHVRDTTPKARNKNKCIKNEQWQKK